MIHYICKCKFIYIADQAKKTNLASQPAKGYFPVPQGDQTLYTVYPHILGRGTGGFWENKNAPGRFHYCMWVYYRQKQLVL